MLNAAKRQGIELSPAEVEAIKAVADAMASSEARTKALKEAVEFGKETTKSFFSDIKSSLLQGKTLWESFGTAAENALNKIADKLMNMAIDDLFNAAFGGSGGGGSGGLGGMIMNLFGGGGGGISASGGGFDIGAASAMPGGFMPGFANGAAFRAGNVVPFAGGGVVTAPTFFPMSRGRTGLMGEAGEEGILPLRRRNGRLGVEASGVGGGGQVVVTVTGDTDLVRVTARDEAGRAIAVAAPAIEDRAVKRAGNEVVPRVERNDREGGGDWRVR